MITKDLKKVFSANIREYGMYIALVVIMGIFQWLTNGLFLSSRNIVNLFNQSGYIAVLAVGVTLVIVIRQIDMSIGFLAGFLGALAAIALVQWHLPVAVVIPGILMLGVCAGLVTAYPVARMAIPSFVTSLAGWLDDKGKVQLQWSATSLLGCFAIMILQDLAGGQRVMRCPVCSGVFLAKSHQAKFCSKTCRDTYHKREQRRREAEEES